MDFHHIVFLVLQIHLCHFSGRSLCMFLLWHDIWQSPQIQIGLISFHAILRHADFVRLNCSLLAERNLSSIIVKNMLYLLNNDLDIILILYLTLPGRGKTIPSAVFTKISCFCRIVFYSLRDLCLIWLFQFVLLMPRLSAFRPVTFFTSIWNTFLFFDRCL